MKEKITQTAGRQQLGTFAPMFAHLNDDVLFAEVWNEEAIDTKTKCIIPFCSHGGGRFGQSLTAIAKLAPESNIGQGLSVHYSGGSTLSEDVAAWLEANHLKSEA